MTTHQLTKINSEYTGKWHTHCAGGETLSGMVYRHGAEWGKRINGFTQAQLIETLASMKKHTTAENLADSNLLDAVSELISFDETPHPELDTLPFWFRVVGWQRSSLAVQRNCSLLIRATVELHSIGRLHFNYGYGKETTTRTRTQWNNVAQAAAECSSRCYGAPRKI